MGLIFTHGSLAIRIRKFAFPTTKNSDTACYLQQISGWIDYSVILYSQVTGESIHVSSSSENPNFVCHLINWWLFFANVNSVDVEVSKEFICRYNTHVSSVIMSPVALTFEGGEHWHIVTVCRAS